MDKDFKSVDSLAEFLADHRFVLTYFSADFCQVCKVIKPEIKRLVNKQFNKMELVYIDVEKQPQISGQYLVFSIPTIIFFADGREVSRFSRNFGISQLQDIVSRYYSMIFD